MVDFHIPNLVFQGRENLTYKTVYHYCYEDAIIINLSVHEFKNSQLFIHLTYSKSTRAVEEMIPYLMNTFIDYLYSDPATRMWLVTGIKKIETGIYCTNISWVKRVKEQVDLVVYYYTFLGPGIGLVLVSLLYFLHPMRIAYIGAGLFLLLQLLTFLPLYAARHRMPMGEFRLQSHVISSVIAIIELVIFLLVPHLKGVNL